MDRALAFFGNLAGKTVIDLGCGEGATSLYLARRGARVLAVDFSRPAVEHLAAYCRAHGIDGVECVCEDALHVDRLGPVNAIFGSMILHHLEPFDAVRRVSPRGAGVGRACVLLGEQRGEPRLDVVPGSRRGARMDPKFGDPAERPLSPREVDELRKRLHVEVEYPEMHFFRMLSGYVFKGRLHQSLSSLDEFFFRHRLLVNWSYRQYLMLERQ